MTPISQLIEELKCDVHQVEKVIKRAGLTDCQRKIYNKQKETLNEVLFTLEVNYLNIEVAFINKMKK